MTGSLIAFVLFIMIYIIISDIFTVFFRLTGLTEEKARFQVISLLTNSGFTTRESEAIVSSNIRRRLARVIMLFGYAFTVTIVSATVNFFMTLSATELDSLLYLVPLLMGVFVLFYLIRKSSIFKTKFDTWIENIGNRIMFGKHSNPVLMLEEFGDMVVAHVYLQEIPVVLEGVPLSQTELMSKHHIMVMMVKKRNGDAQQANANTILQREDIIMVLGKKKEIRSMFERVE